MLSTELPVKAISYDYKSNNFASHLKKLYLHKRVDDCGFPSLLMYHPRSLKMPSIFLLFVAMKVLWTGNQNVLELALVKRGTLFQDSGVFQGTPSPSPRM